MDKIKQIIMLVSGGVGVVLSTFLGGMDYMLIALLIFMGIDIVSGVLVAINGRSAKTDSGGLNSKISWLGISKKAMVLLLVGVGHWLDGMIGVGYIRTAIIFAYAANELLSIMENSTLLGLPGSKVLSKVVDILNAKADEEGD